MSSDNKASMADDDMDDKSSVASKSSKSSCEQKSASEKSKKESTYTEKKTKKHKLVIRTTREIKDIIADQTRVVFETDSAFKGSRVSRFCPDRKLLSEYFEGVTTVYDCFQRGVELSGDEPFLGWKPASGSPYKWMTYNEVAARVSAFADGLVALGFEPRNVTRIGIYSQNRPEYFIADHGTITHNMCPVPLYDSLGEQACRHIVDHAELRCVVVDSNRKVKHLLGKGKSTSNITHIIMMDDANSETAERCQMANVELLQLEDVEELGRENPLEPHPPAPDDLCVVCYTSGTTGTPKGVMLSHKNMSAVVAASARTFEASGVTISKDDTLISYLPLAHSYERVLETYIMTVGGQIGYYQGDIARLMDNIKELQPTFFPSMPRLLNRMYDKVMSEVNNSGRIRKFLFNMAMKSKAKDLKKGVICNNSAWDKLAFKHVQASLGGRLRLITTGSAPISTAVLNLHRCIAGCPVIEGYGQTENCGVATFTLVGDSEPDHVGMPIPSLMVKLQDVPELGYFSCDNKGEVCLRGESVFLGYLKDQELTDEVMDEDRWLYTGDIGEWTPSGTLKIIDRKKDIFKLAQGEYVAPAKIENLMSQSEFLSQVYVHGDSLQSFIVAVVVPDQDTLPALCSKISAAAAAFTFKDLCENKAVKAAIMEDLKLRASKDGLSSLEQVKDIYVHPEPFSVENDLLTSTFKLKRHEVRKRFSKQIADMYKKNNSAV